MHCPGNFKKKTKVFGHSLDSNLQENFFTRCKLNIELSQDKAARDLEQNLISNLQEQIYFLELENGYLHEKCKEMNKDENEKPAISLLKRYKQLEIETAQLRKILAENLDSLEKVCREIERSKKAKTSSYQRLKLVKETLDNDRKQIEEDINQVLKDINNLEALSESEAKDEKNFDSEIRKISNKLEKLKFEISSSVERNKRTATEFIGTLLQELHLNDNTLKIRIEQILKFIKSPLKSHFKPDILSKIKNFVNKYRKKDIEDFFGFLDHILANMSTVVIKELDSVSRRASLVSLVNINEYSENRIGNFSVFNDNLGETYDKTNEITEKEIELTSNTSSICCSCCTDSNDIYRATIRIGGKNSRRKRFKLNDSSYKEISRIKILNRLLDCNEDFEKHPEKQTKCMYAKYLIGQLETAIQRENTNTELRYDLMNQLSEKLLMRTCISNKEMAFFDEMQQKLKDDSLRKFNDNTCLINELEACLMHGRVNMDLQVNLTQELEKVLSDLGLEKYSPSLITSSGLHEKLNKAYKNKKEQKCANENFDGVENLNSANTDVNVKKIKLNRQKKISKLKNNQKISK